MKNTKKLIFAALLAALCCVITMYPKFPTLFGYIHAGDTFVLLSAFLLGPYWGALSAGLGSALADLICGYAQYVPGTFVIKALMALAAGFILKKYACVKVFPAAAVAGIVAEAIMVLGYLAYEALLLGYGAAAIGSVPTNLVQAVFGAAAACALYAALMKSAPFRRQLGLDEQKSKEK